MTKCVIMQMIITDYGYLYYVAYTVITPLQRFLALGRFGSRRAGAEIMGGGGSEARRSRGEKPC